MINHAFSFLPAESVVAHEVDSPSPHKIDQNMWKNREHIEEILFLLEAHGLRMVIMFIWCYIRFA